MEKPLCLKRYSNRRLYNTRDSSHVTLAEVSEMIREGDRIEVVDAKTGEDVTAYTLTQILVEEARSNHFLLPVPLLHMMIRYGNTLLSEFFENYLEQAIRNYAAYKTAVDEQFGRWMEMGMSGTPPGTLADLLDQLQDFAPTGSKGGKSQGDKK